MCLVCYASAIMSASADLEPPLIGPISICPIKIENTGVWSENDHHDADDLSKPLESDKISSTFHDIDENEKTKEFQDVYYSLPLECDVELSLPVCFQQKPFNRKHQTSDAQLYASRRSRTYQRTKPKKSVSFSETEKRIYDVLHTKQYERTNEVAERRVSAMDNVTSWMVRNMDHFAKSVPESPTLHHTTSTVQAFQTDRTGVPVTFDRVRATVAKDVEHPDFDVRDAVIICSQVRQKALSRARLLSPLPSADPNGRIYENVTSLDNNTALKDLDGLLTGIGKSDLGNPDHSGWLLYQRTGRAVWCVLSGILFSIFADENEQQPLDTLPLPACEIEAVTLREKYRVERQPRTVRAFAIDCDILARAHCLIVTSERELLAWLCMLKIAGRRDVGLIASLTTDAQETHDKDVYGDSGTEEVRATINEANSAMFPDNSGTTLAIDSKSRLRDMHSLSLGSPNKGNTLSSSGLHHPNSMLLQRIDFDKPTKLTSKSKSCSNLMFSSELFPSVVNIKKSSSERDIRPGKSPKNNYFNRIKFTSILAKRAADIKERIFGRRMQNSWNDIYVATLINVKVSGYLLYKNLLKWQTLWCAVSKTYLYGFKSREPYEKPVLILPLPNSTVVYVSTRATKPKTSKRAVFKITTSKNKSIYLGSSDNAELCRWLQVLQMEANSIRVDAEEWKTKIYQSILENSLLADGPANADTEDGDKKRYKYVSSSKTSTFPPGQDTASICSTVCSAAIDNGSGSHDDPAPDHYDNALRHVWENDENYRLKKLRAKIRRERIAEVMERGWPGRRRRQGNNGVLILNENSQQKTKSDNMAAPMLNSSGSSAIVSSTEEDCTTSSDSDFIEPDRFDVTRKRRKPPTVREIRAAGVGKVDCSGYMNKRQQNGAWIRFWYVLSARKLYCYLTPDDEVTADITNLREYSLIRNGGTVKQSNVLQLVHSKWTTKQLSVATNGEYQLWCYVIQQATQDGERLTAPPRKTKNKVQSETTDMNRTQITSKLTDSCPFQGDITRDQSMTSLLPRYSRIPGRRQIAESLGCLSAQTNTSTSDHCNMDHYNPLPFKADDRDTSSCVNPDSTLKKSKQDPVTSRDQDQVNDISSLRMHRAWIADRISNIQKTFTLPCDGNKRKKPLFGFKRAGKGDAIRKQTAESELRYLIYTLVNMDKEISEKAQSNKQNSEKVTNDADNVGLDVNDDFPMASYVIKGANGNPRAITSQEVQSLDENNNSFDLHVKNYRTAFMESNYDDVTSDNGTVANGALDNSKPISGTNTKRDKQKQKRCEAILAFESTDNDFHGYCESRDLRDYHSPTHVVHGCPDDTYSRHDTKDDTQTECRGTQTADAPKRNMTRRLASETVAQVLSFQGEPITRNEMTVMDRGTQTPYSCILAATNLPGTPRIQRNIINPDVLAEIEAFEELTRQKLCQLSRGV